MLNKSLGELLKDGYRVVEYHEREVLEKDGRVCGMLNEYIVLETPHGRILYSPETQRYLEFECEVGEENGSTGT